MAKLRKVSLIIATLISMISLSQAQNISVPSASTPKTSVLVKDQLVRFTVPNDTSAYRIEVMTQDGESVFDSEWMSGQDFDWAMTNQQGELIKGGLYHYSIVVKGNDGLSRSTQRGHLIVDRAGTTDRIWVVNNDIVGNGMSLKGIDVVADNHPVSLAKEVVSSADTVGHKSWNSDSTAIAGVNRQAINGISTIASTPAPVTVTIDGTKFTAIEAIFSLQTGIDKASLPVLQEIAPKVDVWVDLSNDKNVPFATLMKLFTLSYIPDRDKFNKQMKIEFWKDDSQQNVINSIKFAGWISKFEQYNPAFSQTGYPVITDGNGQAYRNLLHIQLVPVISSLQKITIGN